MTVSVYVSVYVVSVTVSLLRLRVAPNRLELMQHESALLLQLLRLLLLCHHGRIQRVKTQVQLICERIQLGAERRDGLVELQETFRLVQLDPIGCAKAKVSRARGK